ncbi:hypothetical protein LTR66_016116 [Elasticomyces elasticus]|nr:hypothetical protein LTR66_016116 [Elasticomyces elasticus]
MQMFNETEKLFTQESRFEAFKILEQARFEHTCNKLKRHAHRKIIIVGAEAVIAQYKTHLGKLSVARTSRGEHILSTRAELLLLTRESSSLRDRAVVRNVNSMLVQNLMQMIAAAEEQAARRYLKNRQIEAKEDLNFQ